MSGPRTVERDPITVTVREATRLAGVSASTIYGLLNTGELEGRYLKSKRLIMFDSLKAYLHSLPTDAPVAS